MTESLLVDCPRCMGKGWEKSSTQRGGPRYCTLCSGDTRVHRTTAAQAMLTEPESPTKGTTDLTLEEIWAKLDAVQKAKGKP